MLFNEGLYSLPTIWTIYSSILNWTKIYKEEIDRVRIRLGGEVFTPQPYLTYTRCQDCSLEVKHLLSIRSVYIMMSENYSESKECCNKTLCQAKEISLEDLFERINHFLSKLEKNHQIKITYC